MPMATDMELMYREFLFDLRLYHYIMCFFSGTAAGSRWGVAKVTKRPQSNCCYILIPGLVGQLDRCQSAQ